MLRRRLAPPLLAVTLLVGGCTTYRDQLTRGQRAFDKNDHDRTLAILRDLEPDMRRLSAPEQAEYAYLRGMTDYRIGYRPDARHWLAVAKAMEDHSPGMLPGEWKGRLNEALDELNHVVYAEGTSALSTTRLADSEQPGRPTEPAAPPKKDEPAKPDEPPKEEPPKKEDPAKKDGAPKKAEPSRADAPK